MEETVMDMIRVMEASVRKWQAIIEGKRADGGVWDCPPCRLFYLLVCIGCPIAKHTGQKFCKGSPYPRWYWHQLEVHDKLRRRVYCPECLVYATQMRDFMIEIVEDLKAKRVAARGGRKNAHREKAAS